jgi:hypothetical protein
MAGPQIDDATAARLGRMFVEMSHHPKGRKGAAHLVREVMPDSPEARSFADVEQEERFESFKREQEEREIERQKDAAVAKMGAQRSRLISGGDNGEGRKYSEDDVKKIEELMQKKGIIDYEDGATLYAATLPPSEPKPGKDIPEVHGTTWDFPEFQKFGKDPVRASRETANQVITELMRQRR